MVEQDRRRVRRWLALGGLLMAIAAVVVLVTDPSSDDTGSVPEGGSRFGQEQASSHGGLLEVLAPVLRPDAPPSAGLPVERAVAQLFAVGFEGTRPPEPVLRRVRTRGWGIVIVGGTNYRSPSQLRSAVASVRRQARRGRQLEPLFMANPDELGRLGPPPASEIGLDGTPSEAGGEAAAASRRLRRVGIRLVLAPSADLGVGGGPAEDRAFSDDPTEAARFVSAAVRGWLAGRVLPAPGRFPGEGGASQDPLLGPATVGLSLPELVRRDVRPFAAVARTAPAMQMSSALYVAWDGVTPATLLPDAVALLRHRLRFRGAVVSGDLIAATAAGTGGIARAAVDALKACCDVLVVPGGRADQDTAYRAVLDAVRRGEVPRARLVEAVRRVRALKALVR